MSSAPTLSDYLAENAAPEIGAAVEDLCRTMMEPEISLAATGLRYVAAPECGVAGIDGGGRLAAAIAFPAPGAEDRGALFALYPAAPGTPEASFLRPGTEQVAAGCCVPGVQTRLLLTVGQGTALFVRDPGTGDFRLDTPRLRIPDRAEFAADVAQYRHWDRPVQRFVDDCLAGADGPFGHDFTMRWTGSLAAEALHVVTGGGVFLAPHGSPALPDLLHHCLPLAFLAEQAGGQATDGTTRLLDHAATILDATSPLIFGAPADVARIAAYHDLPDSDAAPLFGRRGLFRL